MNPKKAIPRCLHALLFAVLIVSGAWEGALVPTAAADDSAGLILEEAFMCESMDGLEPENKAVVFSLSIGQVLCFTSFRNITGETVIYHKWYRRDRLSTTRKLTLKSPRWSTVSRIQFREADKGPWRVEIVTEDGSIIKTLRFSITD